MNKESIKNVATLLLVLGLIFEILAFFRNEVDSVPFISKVIAPEYIRTMKGIERLNSTLELKPGDIGFEEIAEIYINDMNKANNPQLVEKIWIRRFYVPDENDWKFTITEDFSGIQHALKVELSTGQVLDSKLEFLNEENDKVKQRKIFLYACGLLAIGAFSHVIGIFLHLKQS